MKIHIRYFASLRETIGQSEETLEVPEGSSVAALRSELSARYPALQAILARCISAVNRTYVDAETVLHDDDELVFIPPMGGGRQYKEVR
jgi:sulfur-carrier protein